jgi:hypothetical protein
MCHETACSLLDVSRINIYPCESGALVHILVLTLVFTLVNPDESLILEFLRKAGKCIKLNYNKFGKIAFLSFEYTDIKQSILLVS